MNFDSLEMSGKTIGAFEVRERIGAGGMGEVYRGHDQRLNRSVAIKVLAPDLSNNSQFRNRFQREARVLASLNHPNIAAVYGLEESGGRHFLVMELISGETLSAMLARGKLSVEDTVRYGTQLADALAAAHANGIIHRDFKPGNIMIAKSMAKVLDFGLAKSVGDDTLTGSHVVMGTPAYMAPEQLSGKECDARTDIYALGLVLFEMVTGKRFSQAGSSFEGVPEKLAHVIEQCVQKNPDDRWQSVSDVRKEIVWCAKPKTGLSLPDTSSSKRWVWPIAAALVLGALLGTAGLKYFRSTDSAATPRVARLALPQSGASAVTFGQMARNLAITPNGLRVVYVGNNGTQLFVRSLDAREPTPIATGSSLQFPFISTDGQWVGYLDGGYVMKKVSITGGSPPVKLLGRGRGGAMWLPDGTIIYSDGSQEKGLIRISAVQESPTGTPEVLTRPNAAADEANHLWPELLPGGQAILFTIIAQRGGLDAAQVAIYDLRTHKPKILFRGGSAARYVAAPFAKPGSPNGYLVFVAKGGLQSIGFDLSRLEAQGTATTLAEQVVTDLMGDGDFAVANNGTLLYADASDSTATVRRALVWVDRKGREEAAGPPPNPYLGVSISPTDESRFALTILDDGQIKIWIWNGRLGTFTKLSFDPGKFTGAPVWTPDGNRIIFQGSTPGSAVSMWWMAADGLGDPERLATSPDPQVATSITDASHLIFHQAVQATNLDILELALGGNSEITPLIHTSAFETSGVVSPNKHWLAYQCCTESQREIYVSTYPKPQDGHWQVSDGGGRLATWSATSKELFFVASDGWLMRVGVEGVGPAWQASLPSRVLDLRRFRNQISDTRPYDISHDGQRFLLIKQVEAQSNGVPPQIMFTLDWTQELAK